MADTVNLPKIGPVKKVYVYGTAGTVGAYVLWRYWRAGAGAGAAAEEIPAETDNSSVTQAPGGAYGPGNVQYAGSTTQEDEDLIVTNADWTNVALDRVTGAGFDDNAAATALGKFLQRQKLTVLEVAIVQFAIASTGQPPVGGPYPISPTTTTTPPPTTQNPHVKAPVRPGVVSTNTVHSTNAIIVWGGVPGATKYQIKWTGGTKTLPAQNNYRIEGLKPNTSVRVQVRAGNAGGWSPWTQHTFRTLKKG